MGEIADAILEGVFCQHCGEVMDDQRAPGHPRSCFGCMTAEQRGDVRHQRLRELEGEFNGEPLEQWTEPAVREVAKEKRRNNREQSTNLLRARGVEFETKNAGAHLIVRAAGRVFDFWPGTGKYMERGDRPVNGRGVFELLKELKRKKVTT
jgi:hypothetical protein